MSFRANLILLFIYLAWQMVSAPALCQPQPCRLQYIFTDSADAIPARGRQQEFKDSASVIRHLGTEISELWSQGFLAAGIDSVRFDSLQAVAWIYKGEKYHWAAVTPDSTVEKIFKQLPGRTGKILSGPVDPVELASVKEKIIRYMENDGYPFAAVSLEDISISGWGDFGGDGTA